VRHPWQWISGAGILCGAAWLVVTLSQVEGFKYSAVAEFMTADVILNGVMVTLQLTILCMAIGLVGGVLLALARLSMNPVLRSTSGLFIWFFRGTPLVVQLIFWYNLSFIFEYISIGIPGGPELFSAPTNQIITGFVAALLGLGLNEAAYMAEIVRAGLISVHRGQSEAALALGMRPSLIMRRVVLPQAIPIIIPPTGNKLIGLLKDTSLVSVIAGGDLLTRVQNLSSQNFLILELLVVASIWYLLLTTVGSIGQSYLERHYTRSSGKQRKESRWTIATARLKGKVARP
jgi:polar amino acid transport system permease protein